MVTHALNDCDSHAGQEAHDHLSGRWCQLVSSRSRYVIVNGNSSLARQLFD